MTRRVLALAGGLLLGLLGVGAAADAAVRYASPSGVASATCPDGSPCDIVTAVNAAAANDEVIILPGTYSISTALSASQPNLSVHGQNGQPLPMIETSGFNGISVGSLARVGGLKIVHTGTNAGLFMFGGLAERVLVRSSDIACFARGTLRDSVCHTTGPAPNNGILLTGVSADATLRNVTAIAEHHAAIWAFTSTAGAAVSIAGRGVIARGSTVSGTQPDVRATANNATATATVTLDRSNYGTVLTGGAGTASITPPGTDDNQTATPLFANAAAGDFHQLEVSPTVNAGIVDSVSGTLDLDGNPRTLGAAPDIGAYEYVPADLPAAPPSDTTPPRLRLSGKKRQKLGKRIAVKALCADEACAATAKGKLVVRGSPKREFKLRAAQADLAAGERRKLRLRVPKRAMTAAAKALEASGKAKAKLEVAATDAAGNPALAKRRVRLR